MRLVGVAKREFQGILKQPKFLVFLFGAPLLYTLIFGLLYIKGNVCNIPTVIYDASQTQISRSLTSNFEDSEKYQIVGYVSTQEEMEEYLRDRKAVAAIAIPEEFSRNLKKGSSSETLVLVNGNNLVFANTIISSANEIIQTFSAGVGIKSLESMGQVSEAAKSKATPVQLRLRILNNPTLNYSNFMMLGLVVTVIQQAVLLTVALAMIQEYRKLEDLKHLPAWLVVLGKAIPYWLLGSLSLAMGLAITHFLFGVPFKSSLSSLILLCGGFVFAITFLGMIFSSICSDELTATQYAMLYAMPSFLYSGFTWPIESMNRTGQIIALFSPVNYIANDLRDLALSGYAPFMQKNSLTLIITGLVLYLASSLLFSLKRKKATASETVEA